MLETITIAVSEIQEGDEFHGPDGKLRWIAVEPGYYANGAQRVQVQYWPDGGIGPAREWENPDLPIIIRRPIPADQVAARDRQTR